MQRFQAVRPSVDRCQVLIRLGCMWISFTHYSRTLCRRFCGRATTHNTVHLKHALWCWATFYRPLLESEGGWAIQLISWQSQQQPGKQLGNHFETRPSWSGDYGGYWASWALASCQLWTTCMIPEKIIQDSTVFLTIIPTQSWCGQ
jgi:hypothetical protein